MLLIALAVLAAEPAFKASKDRLEALAKAEKKLAQAPDDPKVLLTAGLIFRMAGRYEESLELLARCPTVPCQMATAINAAMTDDASAHLGFYEKWLGQKQPPEDLMATLRTYSQALVRSGRASEAVAAAEKAVATVDAPMVRLDLAIAQIAAGKLKDGETTIDAVLTKVPDQQAALFWKYYCLKARKDSATRKAATTAFEALTAAVSDKLQDRGDLHFLLAEVSDELGKKDVAKEHRKIAAALHVTRHWPDKPLP